MPSNFIISLDFELKWGIFDVLGPEYDKNLIGARKAIPMILDIFEKNDIKATWAIVGLLFASKRADFNKFKPLSTPSYVKLNLNPYNQKIGESEASDKFHYAASLVELIDNTKFQEIASHTYCHYYCKEPGQTKIEFENDIKSMALISSEKISKSIKSIVFPRNEVNIEYFDILIKNGFTHFRGNPESFFYSKGHRRFNLPVRLLRLVDSYLNITGNQVSVREIHNGLINIVGNRILRPYSHNSILNFLMIRRIKNEMLYAAKHNKNYQVYWHPHNFGLNIDKNIENLSKLIDYYHVLNKEYGMISSNISDI
jgi:peptidoglycan/xylan/chitin deacetylase (PgdA/CDA1 family)